MTEEEQEEILQIVRKIQSSIDANDDFNRLILSLEHIQKTQSKICSDMELVMSKQKEAREKLNEMFDALYDPDRGIYKRIHDTTSADNKQEEDLDRLEDDQEDISNILFKQNAKIAQIEQTHKNLKKVAGERMEHLDSVVKMNKNTKKLFWTGAFALLAIIAKELGPAIVALFM